MRRLFRSGAAQGRAPLRPAPSRREPTEVSALVRLVSADERTAAAAAVPSRPSPRPADAGTDASPGPATAGTGEPAAAGRAGRTVRFPRADGPASPLVRARASGTAGASAPTPPRAAEQDPPGGPGGSPDDAGPTASSRRAAEHDTADGDGPPSAGEPKMPATSRRHPMTPPMIR
jgi:hypothetical protein